VKFVTIDDRVAYGRRAALVRSLSESGDPRA